MTRPGRNLTRGRYEPISFSPLQPAPALLSPFRGACEFPVKGPQRTREEEKGENREGPGTQTERQTDNRRTDRLIHLLARACDRPARPRKPGSALASRSPRDRSTILQVARPREQDRQPPFDQSFDHASPDGFTALPSPSIRSPLALPVPSAGRSRLPDPRLSLSHSVESLFPGRMDDVECPRASAHRSPIDRSIDRSRIAEAARDPLASFVSSLGLLPSAT